jgi:hypothetical protein
LKYQSNAWDLVYDLNREIRLADCFLHQVMAAFAGQLFASFFTLQDKHSNILLRNQNHAAHIGVFDQKCVRFVPSNEIVPSGAEVDEHEMLI